MVQKERKNPVWSKIQNVLERVSMWERGNFVLLVIELWRTLVGRGWWVGSGSDDGDGGANEVGGDSGLEVSGLGSEEMAS